MARRYLIGPTNRTFLRENLSRQYAAGECLCFDYQADADVTVGAGDTWESLHARLPSGWRPDFVALTLRYTRIPTCLWSAPVPLVALPADANLLWHQYRLQLPHCDLVFSDPATVAACRRVGVAHAEAANLYGCERAFLQAPPVEAPRSIDVLFVGNFHPAVQRERLSWLARLAPLAERSHVVLRTGVFGAPYRELLQRSRIVFNRSIRGECNQRAIEAAASGALLFQEADNREVPAYFQDRKECVFYTADNLISLLDHYLTREDERRTLAAAGRARAQSYSFEKLWDRVLDRIDAQWEVLQARARRRARPEGRGDLRARVWQALSAGDPTLVADLVHAVQREPHAAELHHALGLARALAQPREECSAEAVAQHFRQALACDPEHVLAALHLAEALGAGGHADEMVAIARQTLAVLDRTENPDATAEAPAWLEAGHFPPGFDYLRVEWERAAWDCAGDPAAEAYRKRHLVRWRLHTLLAAATGDLGQARAAVNLRPDLPTTRVLLGTGLLRDGQPAEAVEHFRAAVSINPFDLDAARLLHRALGAAVGAAGQDLFARERLLLSRAAPQVVPPEPWFARGAEVDKTDRTRESPSARGSTGPRFAVVTQAAFAQQYGELDAARAVHSFTRPHDTRIVLALLAHARPRRLLEIGTALGHMTANFTEWSPDDATVFTLGVVSDLAVRTSAEQGCEDPTRADFGRFANHFGKVHKVCFITADSLAVDFARLGPLDFVFVDGAHDLEHVLSDTRKVYEVLSPGGWLVWHDFDSPVPWVRVREALETLTFPETIYHVAGTEVAYLQKSGAPAAVRASAPPPALRIAWEGPQQALHSLALVNRQFCACLAARGHELALLPTGPDEQAADAVRLPQSLEACLRRPLSGPADIHVRLQWPPQWTPPAEGRWVIIQPWEFGSLPRAWIEPLSNTVDEVWVPSRFVRDCFVQSGVPAERVQVVPLGVDVERFHPKAPPRELRTRKRFKFLFVGGTIHRKGFDLLLEAYGRTFSAGDNVCLVVKDMGVGTFYRGQTAGRRIASFRGRTGAPEVEYLDASLSEAELAGLYTACDCLVHPYRGEGFGLPIVEAMASGLPVVVTGYGSALDFCDETTAYLVPSTLKRFAERCVGDVETVDNPWLAEPDVEALASLLRRVSARPGEAAARGKAGRERVVKEFTWEHAAAVVERRLDHLRRQPVRRPLERTTLSSPVSEAAVEPTVVVSTRPQGTRPRVSLCMIVRNEEANLAACLGPAADLVDEIVVVDTGSTDQTREVARRLGARVFDFPWCDSFAAARNETLRHATGDWIFWLDADDRLDEDNRGKLRRLFAGLTDENAAYVLKCLCLPDVQTQTSTRVDHVRLFRNRPEHRWQYRVHEQILPALRQTKAAITWTDVVVCHTGYQDPALRDKKRDRDLRLLRLQDEERPNDPFTLFNLGMIYQDQGEYVQALSVLRRSLERSQTDDSIVRKLYALIVQCHRRLKQYAEAQAACREGQGHYPEDSELLFVEAILRHEQKDLDGAVACLLRLLAVKPGEHFASVDAGLCSYKARHNLAVIYQEKGCPADAEAQWRAALRDQPTYTPALLGLADLCLAQRRWAELDGIASWLDGVEAAVLRARRHLADKDYVRARGLLESTIAQAPQAHWPRKILTHVLLQEDRDWPAAEKALRDLLALDPDNAEARHNLDILLRRQGRTPG